MYFFIFLLWYRCASNRETDHYRRGFTLLSTGGRFWCILVRASPRSARFARCLWSQMNVTGLVAPATITSARTAPMRSCKDWSRYTLPVYCCAWETGISTVWVVSNPQLSACLRVPGHSWVKWAKWARLSQWILSRWWCPMYFLNGNPQALNMEMCAGRRPREKLMKLGQPSGRRERSEPMRVVVVGSQRGWRRDVQLDEERSNLLSYLATVGFACTTSHRQATLQGSTRVWPTKECVFFQNSLSLWEWQHRCVGSDLHIETICGCWTDSSTWVGVTFKTSFRARAVPDHPVYGHGIVPYIVAINMHKWW